MGARGAILLVMGLCGIAAAGEPKPKEIDIKGIKNFLVLEYPEGGTFVVTRDGTNSDSRVFYGPTTAAFYEQPVGSRSTAGQGWSLSWYVRRIDGLTPVSVSRRDDDLSYNLGCPIDQNWKAKVLKEVPADRAKQIVAKAKFFTNGETHIARFLGRDDTGVYYYVDEISKTYGGGGTRVFIGKKGAMKEVQLLDVATDTGGAVYSTKSGDVRLVVDADDEHKSDATFVKGAKRSTLRILDIYQNSRLIYNDLGIYNFIGTPCESY